MLGLDFPPISHLFEWPDFAFDGTPLAMNKTVLIYLMAFALTLGLFLIAGARKALVPTGLQTIAESGIEFVENGIIEPTMGAAGKKFLPLLTTMFFFIFFTNIFEVIPFIQFPANARMALPLAMAVMVWGIYNYQGFKHNGLGYLKNHLFPKGVPIAVLPLVALIELLQLLVIRPASLAIRLWANMVAGHLLLVTFAVLSAALWDSTYIGAAAPFVMLVLMTGFEILVSFLQAFIFTILTAVYIDGSIHSDH
ncbi:MAG: F0F1 ATP synthase subunit A [Actinomycetia bacterium]|nr:F0F1 ATP synthase subunit A [Actinomycetes bacterium]MCP5031877.1 F0F1 ATP synthase subunit A [Actinomycetes bacterium]